MLEDQRKRRIEVSATTGQTARKKPMLATNIVSSTLESRLPSTDGPGPADSEARSRSGSGGVDDDELETFRKEALWRQLQEYKRDLRRAQEKLEQSEEQKSDAETRLAAIDVCWNQLIEDVRLLFKDSSTGLDDTNTILSSLPASPTNLDRALQQRSMASKDLIIHLISLASSAPASPDLEEVRSRCRRLTAESANTRAALGLAASKLKQLQDQLEFAEEATRRAEKKLDRERSRTVRALYAQGQGGSASTSSKPDAGAAAVEEPTKPLSHVTNGSQNCPSTPLNAPTANGVTDPNHQEVDQDLAESRSRELTMVKDELLRRAEEIDVLQWKLANMPDEAVQDTPVYKRLKTEAAHATAELQNARTLLETTQKEADDLRERQDEYRAAIVSEMTSRLEDMEKRLAGKDADVTRIRATREEARSELHELKSRDAEKMKQVAQIRTLANSRQDRINALSSEVRRLKMRLAADLGDRESVEFLATNEEIELAKGLQERLKKADETITSLQHQLDQHAQASGSEGTASLIQSEAQARMDLAQIQQRVANFERLLGPDANPDVNEMAKKLQSELDRQRALEAKLAAQEASATMLYTEVDRLSTAWAALDEQNRDKVFKIAEHDEKVLKAVHEKAKADNRYFSAMRANETLKAQAAVLEKMAEKQTSAISKMSDELRAISNRLATAEREISGHQRLAQGHKARISDLSIENADLLAKCSQHDRVLAEMSVVLRNRTIQFENEGAARRNAEANAINLDKELQKTKAKLHNTDGQAVDTVEFAELKSYSDDLTKMLKCSSCRQRFKSHVITRCMHLFCHPCLEARLETRQRKCPTCSIAFGTNDVAAVYF